MRAPTKLHPLAPWASDIAQPLGALVVFVVAWEALCRLFHVPAYLVPAPSAIFTDTAQLAGPVVMHPLATTHTVLLGFASSVVDSLPLGVLSTGSPVIAHAIYRLLDVSQTISSVALVPLATV